MTYKATNRSTDETITVRGRSIEEAAQHAVERFTRHRNVQAHRETGEPGLSGIWQGYLHGFSRGPNVHVA